MKLVPPAALLFLLLSTAAQAQANPVPPGQSIPVPNAPSAVRVQITYFSVSGAGGFAAPDFNPHFDDPHQALKAFQYQAVRQRYQPYTVPGPVAIARDGTTARARTATGVGSAVGITRDGKPIDTHAASFHEHALSVLPRLGPGGTVRVEITLRDGAYVEDDRSHLHLSDQTPRYVKKTLDFRPGDTLLLTPPVAQTAGDDYAFATVTLLPSMKG